MSDNTLDRRLIAIVENIHGIKHFEFMGDTLLAVTSDRPESMFTVGTAGSSMKADYINLRQEAQAFLAMHRKLTS